MDKVLIKNKQELTDLITKCYESDPYFISNYHATHGYSLNSCVNTTINDLTNDCDVDVYALYNNNSLIGYFGEEKDGLDKWMTGFFILKDKRSLFKKEVWDSIVNHFDNNFLTCIYFKNESAKKFLTKNGCTLMTNIPSINGLSSVFAYSKENI